MPAAGLLIAFGVTSWHDAAAEVGRLLPVVGFLAAVLVLARLCDDEGLFHAAGVAMARASADSQHKLLAVVFVIAAATTAILSLDATVVLLTPVVLASVRALAVPPRAYAYATAHLANSASLLFPVSNLTNLLAFTAAGMTFLHFTAVMTLPWLAAIAVEFVLLRWFFGRDLAVKPRSHDVPERPRKCQSSCSPCWRATLIGFAVTSLFEISPAWAALAGAVVLGVRSLAQRRSTPAGILDALNVPFLAFVLCLGVVVDALMQHGLDEVMRAVLPTGTTLLALLGIAAVAAVLSNVVNNLPAVLVLLPLVAGGGGPAILAVLIGVNIGPNLTYVGSLANLLWRSVVHREGIPAGYAEFTRVGLLTVPLTLVASVLGLWCGLQLFYV